MNRLFRCPFAIDEPRLRRAIEARDEARRTLREEFRLPKNSLVAMTVGKLNRSKCVDHAIRAIATVWHAELAQKVYLVVVGDGAERQNLEFLAKSLEPDAIKFAGFVDVVRLPSYYAGADFLIHPSAVDSHPLATAEAVVCGLPVIASDRVGSVGPTDDVRVGLNGFQYSFGDWEALAKLIRHICSDADVIGMMRSHSERVASQRSLAVSVESFVSAVSEVCRRGAA